MDPITARGIAGELADVLREERSRGSLLALVALDLVAFAAAATLAFVVPDALDTAASTTNESALALHPGVHPSVHQGVHAP